MPDDAPPPATLDVFLPEVICPGCKITMQPEIHTRTMVQNHAVLICGNNGCKEYGKRWNAPRLRLQEAAPA